MNPERDHEAVPVPLWGDPPPEAVTHRPSGQPLNGPFAVPVELTDRPALFAGHDDRITPAAWEECGGDLLELEAPWRFLAGLEPDADGWRKFGEPRGRAVWFLAPNERGGSTLHMERMGYDYNALQRSLEDRPPLSIDWKDPRTWPGLSNDGPDAIYMDQVSPAVFELLCRKGFRELGLS
ncbi:MAG: hypothetical protein ACREK5_04840 [Gemmatimonadota bacterium]